MIKTDKMISIIGLILLAILISTAAVCASPEQIKDEKPRTGLVTQERLIKEDKMQEADLEKRQNIEEIRGMTKKINERAKEELEQGIKIALPDYIPPAKILEKKGPAISKEEQKEVKKIFGVRPASAKLTDAWTTGNSSGYNVEYYDRKGNLIGTKHVREYHPIGAPESSYTTTITWTDKDGNIVTPKKKPKDGGPWGVIEPVDPTIKPVKYPGNPAIIEVPLSPSKK